MPGRLARLARQIQQDLVRVISDPLTRATNQQGTGPTEARQSRAEHWLNLGWGHRISAEHAGE